MDESERRNNYRVDAPRGILQEVAIWRDRHPVDGRLALCDLGEPDAIGFAGSGGINITDASTRGLRLCLEPAVAEHLHLTLGNERDAGTLHVYIKLLSPSSGEQARRCTLFLGTRVTHVERVGGAVLLGLHIIARGVPERADKAFRMLDAARYGVRELTCWCDAVARMGRGGLTPPSPGLDIEHLLAELAATKASGEERANRNIL